MKTLLFFISVVLLIIFFGDLIFEGNPLNSENADTLTLNSENKNLLFVSELYPQYPLSMNQIDSLTASENLKFTKPNARKLIVKM